MATMLRATARATSNVLRMVNPRIMPAMTLIKDADIQYTICDEAPQLATYAFLPVVQKFSEAFGINVAAPDISLAGRIIANFPDNLTEDQKMEDELSQLGDLVKDKKANVIKLPNISASVPQLNAAIAELQAKGYDIPSYPANPSTDEERAVAQRYGKVIGSAVNPVLREGNSDRRVAPPVKAYAAKNRLPVRVSEWPANSRAHVAHMTHGDFFESEQSATMDAATTVSIEFVDASGTASVLKADLPLQAGEVIDGMRMSVAALRQFFEEQIAEAKKDDILLSLHLKATMMKVSDPIIFGHCVSVYFKDVFAKYADALAALGVNPNNGVQDLMNKVNGMSDATTKAAILADMDAAYANGPKLAMVDSRNGITNLHVPNDVIIDASMPPLVRDGGRMWNKDDALEDTKALIPDRSYATMYQAMIEDCQKHGQYDHSTMGSVANVGLMAQKAEEYGSHDKTFVAPGSGSIRVVQADGTVCFQHAVDTGDIWRMCQTKDAPIKDWVRLAVDRARATGDKTIFYLDEARAHDASLIAKINTYIKDHDTSGLDISILPPAAAMTATCERVRAGQNTISVTGNVLRDYLTDLFPILELGTSAKMLSIVPLLSGGGLFETGAGGSAPKHVDQFLKEGHLRWDSLGEYLALAVSYEHLGKVTSNPNATLLGETLNQAVGNVLDNNESPSRKVNEIDNRGTSFHIAKHWSRALASHDPAKFGELADNLSANEAKIVQELVECQGPAVDVGGYYKPDASKATAAMRPSAVYNAIIDGAKWN